MTQNEVGGGDDDDDSLTVLLTEQVQSWRFLIFLSVVAFLSLFSIVRCVTEE